MHFTTSIINLIRPRAYVKPVVRVDDYVLEWNEVSCGVPEREITVLKMFIKNAIPSLESNHQHAELLTLEGEKRTNLSRIKLERSLTTGIVSSHSDSEARYEIYVGWDGIVFIDRAETVYGKHDDGSDGYYHSQLEIKWNLGELHKYHL